MRTEFLRVEQDVPSRLRDGFVSAYQEAFGGPPYFETYTPEEVLKDVWDPHLAEGVIVLALAGERVIGFGCAKPVTKSPEDVQEFLHAQRAADRLPVPPEQMWYMSELGVLNGHRGNGIGYQLVFHRLVRIQELGAEHFVMRTAADGSNSLHIYQKVGAVVLPGLQDVSDSEQVTVNLSQSHQRIYLHGSCREAIARIDGMVKV